MKKSPIIVIVVCVLLTLISVSFPYNVSLAAIETTITVSTPANIKPGEQFTISILVAPGATSIAGVQLNLGFNPSLVTVNNVAEGNLLSQSGASTYFIPGSINNVTGTITGVAGAITAPGQAISSPGTFATITLTAGTQRGISPFTLSNVLAGDVNGQSTQIIASSSQISIDNAPVLGTIGAKNVNEGDILTFTVSATDVDGDPLTYSASTLPSGASFDTIRRTFSWTPGYDQTGDYSVRFEVSDGILTHFENCPITVIDSVAETKQVVFSVSSLRINPIKANVGKRIGITVTIANKGSIAGDYEVILTINGNIESRKIIALAAGASQDVKFYTLKKIPGTYLVDVNGLTGSFIIVNQTKR